MSLSEVAEKMNMSEGSLGQLERGETQSPPLATVLRLMAVMNVESIELLLGPPQFPSTVLAQLAAPPAVRETPQRP